MEDKKTIEKTLSRYDITVDWERKKIIYRRENIYLLSYNNLKKLINLLLDLIELLDGKR
ncbi:MAG: hypothetical protein ACP5P7_07295 [Sulfurihydrogenibium sp.]